MQAKRKVLVLGATGGIGGEVARQLLDANWEVVALKRGMTQPVERKDGFIWVKGDALNAEDVALAAQDCSVIVHAVNPPGYRKWSELVLPMIDNTIAAAKAQGALIVLPGTVYNYGPDAFPLLTETSPQHPETQKGKIRKELEHRLRLFSEQNDGRVLIVRAGDFFGPKAGNNWFSQGLIKPGKKITRISLPGKPGIGHQWSYLPDVGQAMVKLIEKRESLEPFALFHLGGHWDADGTQIAQAICRTVVAHGGVRPDIAAFPWWLIKLFSPFSETFKEMLEMRYLWQKEVRMANTKIVSILGYDPVTPLDKAVEATLLGLGCVK